MQEVMRGIDVSRYQGDINWAAVKNSGRKFAIVKCGGVIYGKWEEEAKYQTNMNGAIGAGLHVGIYQYSFALSTIEAREEARMALAMAEKFKGKIDFPIFYDVEDSTIAHLSPAQLAANIRAFKEEIENAGYYCSLYANKNWLTNKIDMSQLKDLDVWVAQYNDVVTYAGNYGIWQFTSTGSVPGIAGNVDENIAYKDYPTIIRGAKLNHLDGTPTPTPTPEPDPKPEVYNRKYKVGQNVTFSTCYISSTAPVAEAIPASKMARNHGTITRVITDKDVHNPYLLDNGLCWVNDGDIRSVNGVSTDKPAPQKGVNANHVGRQVKYNGRLYSDSYGHGAGATVNGIYTLTRVIDGRPTGALLNNGLGWVPAAECTLI